MMPHLRTTPIALFLCVGMAVLPMAVVGFMPHPGLATTVAPVMLGAVIILAALCLRLVTEERWLGLFGLWMLSLFLLQQTNVNFETVLNLTLGLCALVFVQRLSVDVMALARMAFVGAGLLQVGIIALQTFGYVPIWSGLAEPYQVVGTFGNAAYAGLYLAMLAPMAPLVLVPVFLTGIALTKCVTAMIAVYVAFMVRYPRYFREWAGVGALGITAIIWIRGDTLWQGFYRAKVWTLAFANTRWWEWIVGHGTGMWKMTAPLVTTPLTGDQPQRFVQAHSDVVQLLYEGGLIALVFLFAWLWHHRFVFSNGPFVALLVSSLAWFPFHNGLLGWTAVAVIGMALAEEKDPCRQKAKLNESSWALTLHDSDGVKILEPAYETKNHYAHSHTREEPVP